MVIEREGEFVLNMSANQAQSKPSDCVQVAVRSMSQLLILNVQYGPSLPESEAVRKFVYSEILNGMRLASTLSD